MSEPGTLRRTARRLTGRGADLSVRVAGLREATESGSGRLSDDLVSRAEAVTGKVEERLAITGDHTVVALAGATGSGKSSTFNALAGLDLARVGVRRPTTSTATACVWGDDPAATLLDWLDIPPRHRIMRDSSLDSERARRQHDDLGGLVLLDLPDHDSTEVAHHVEMERLIGLTDLMIWVLDPQKYADAAIHRRYLAPMAAHQDVMLVVVNHIDQVPEPERAGLLDDVRRLLARDGLDRVRVLATSARHGDGMADLRRTVSEQVSGKAAGRRRLTTDVHEAAAALAAECGTGSTPRVGEQERDRLVDALAEAAGVPVVVDAVRRASTMRGRQATGWPVTAWLSRLRPDPLRRLHLDRRSGERDLVAAARSSLPEAGQVQRAQVESAVRGVSSTASHDLTRPWAAAVRRAATARSADVRDRLDRAVTDTDLDAMEPPGWANAVRGLQWLLLLAALSGAAWLGALAVMGYLKLPEPSTPRLHGVPIPTGLLVTGVAAGLLLALLCRGLVSLSARRRAARADRALRRSVREVAEELVLDPVQAELERYGRTRDGLRTALG